MFIILEGHSNWGKRTFSILQGHVKAAGGAGHLAGGHEGGRGECRNSGGGKSAKEELHSADQFNTSGESNCEEEEKFTMKRAITSRSYLRFKSYYLLGRIQVRS